MKNKKFKAFTLAEVMIVLVVLGVIATLTVPALISKHIESANRTKIKKAMSVYDTAINKMVIENGIKDNAALYESANSFAPEGNCTNTVSYFKVETTLNDNICTFKTSDGLYWNISKINNPVIAFSKDDLDNSEKSYKLVAHYDNNGVLRIDDLQYESVYGTVEDKQALSELYAYVNPSKSEEVALASSTDAIASGSSYSSGNNYSSDNGYKSGGGSSANSYANLHNSITTNCRDVGCDCDLVGCAQGCGDVACVLDNSPLTESVVFDGEGYMYTRATINGNPVCQRIDYYNWGGYSSVPCE